MIHIIAYKMCNTIKTQSYNYSIKQKPNVIVQKKNGNKTKGGVVSKFNIECCDPALNTILPWYRSMTHGTDQVL